ncbi:MAG: anaerobic ribonucleoside-triphosphate reductase [Treponema sp.]|jgi:ribonucleoside-triphosphate reductase|nr:anaerobic ribonucleoside-triphosphate reductase [Treponema sp.]
MRDLEAIENELARAREALSAVKGTPAEVYSRIVGYYRSVRNWNRGKREEYGQRLVYDPAVSLKNAAGLGLVETRADPADRVPAGVTRGEPAGDTRLLLCVRPSCPACPPAYAAAGRLGLPVVLGVAGTDVGLAEAVKRSVFSTPTAILVSSDGNELRRAGDVDEISRLGEPVAV